jgi:hypothetical protein
MKSGIAWISRTQGIGVSSTARADFCLREKVSGLSLLFLWHEDARFGRFTEYS